MTKHSTSENRSRLPASVEMLPQLVLDNPDTASLLPAGTWVYLPDIGNINTDTLVAAARLIQQYGYEPVPHIPVRRIQSEQVMERRLAQLAEQAGVKNCLIIAGEAEQAGPYENSLALLRSGLPDRYGYEEIGIAGHPEGNREYRVETETEVLFSKARFAQNSDASFRIVTQFGFDATVFYNWARSLPGLGIDLPIHIGLAGPTKLTTLIKYAARCGVGNSLKFLKKRASVLTALTTLYNPEELAREFETQLASEGKTAIEQFHVFPFGGLTKTSEWLYERGSWKTTSIKAPSSCRAG